MRVSIELDNYSINVILILVRCTNEWNLLSKASENENAIVRREVAKNRNTQVHILKKLSYDTNSFVREAVGKNPNTPIGVLERLLKDPEPWVRLAVEENLNNPKEKNRRVIYIK